MLRFYPPQLETRTRFKEDCDSSKKHGPTVATFTGWKPGLASKRIATFLTGLRLSALKAPTTLETRTRFKEDCDPSPQRRTGLRLSALNVGNQDSLQRGLRLREHIVAHSQGEWIRLETRTRFKEDCDCAVAIPSSYSSLLLETRTRFKEDCDTGSAACRASSSNFSVGNQDSLQRGLRRLLSRSVLASWLSSYVGNQDSLQRGLRRNQGLSVASSLANCWKPGLASKRIATNSAGTPAR